MAIFMDEHAGILENDGTEVDYREPVLEGITFPPNKYAYPGGLS
jgi:hypothetical protein